MTVMWIQLWGGLPLAVFIGVVVAARQGGLSWLEAGLRTVPLWAALTWLLTNGLSYGDVLTPSALKVAWGVIAVVAALYAASRYRRGHAQLSAFQLKSLTPFEWVLVTATGGLVLLALITAVMAPPVTIDVLNYHAPRQLMWLQQGSLAHFVTVNDRQLMMPPLAEVMGMQFLALTGDDYWMNLLQWTAYVLLMVTVASTARILGLTRQIALLSVWLIACLPMAYLEASNGKNDLLGALWIGLILREVALARVAGTSWQRGTAFRIGLLVGLAILTKSTALVFAPPLIVAGIWAWRCQDRWPVGRAVVVAALVALVITAPFFLRNWAWYGTPLGVQRAEDGGQQANTAFTPGIVLSNMVRGASQHLSSPVPAWNQALEHGIIAMHAATGIPLNDPRSTYWVTTFSVAYLPAEETIVGAPWHFILIASAVLLALTWSRLRVWRWLAWVVIAMAVGYCAVVKWQPWAPRLQQPVFVVGVVLLAAVIGSFPLKRGKVLVWLAAIIGLGFWWPSRETAARPLWREPSILTTNRDTLAYRYWSFLQERDAKIAEMLRAAAVHNVMIASVHDIPYLLMRRLQREMPGIHFYGAPVSDAIRGNPDAIISLDRLRPLGLYHQLSDGTRYRLVGDTVGDGIYLPESRVRVLGWGNRLPDFAGWTGHVGLAFRADELTGGEAPKTWREMRTDHAELHFPAWGDALFFTATGFKTAPGADSLELAVNGRSIGRVELPEQAARFGFSLRIPCAAGNNTLSLRRSAVGGGVLKFTRIGFNDIAAAP